MRKKHATVASAGVTTAMLVTLLAGTAFADPGVDVVIDEGLAAPENSFEDVTYSTVDFVDAAFDAEYLDEAVVPESVGDAQQQEAVDIADSAEEDAETSSGFIARVDLESDNVTVGATWDLDSPAPTQVMYRYLSDNEWSSWDELQIADEDNEHEGAIRSGTDPYSLANADAVEAIAINEDGGSVPGLELVVIDVNGLDPVENTLEAAVPEEGPQSVDSADLAITSDAAKEEQKDDDAEPAEDTALEGASNETLDEEIQDQSLSDDVLEEESLIEEGLGGAEKRLLDESNISDSDLDGAIPVQTVALNSAQTEFDTGFSGLKIKTRKGWGANESWRNGFVDDKITYQGAVVHHTAGNNNYTQAQVPGQIQGIYKYHAVSLGWGDVGYHLLVDKFGGVWEGRYGSLTRSQQGAQAYGANGQTFGISVLGDYTLAAPSAAAQDSVAKTIAWMFKKWGISDPNGTIRVPGSDLRGRTVSKVSGHRDIGASACPGDAFYSKMPSIRAKVASYLAANTRKVPRLEGTDRMSTAVAVSKHQFPNGAKTVYLVNKNSPVDAMSAGIVKDGPILYTAKSSIPPATLTEIKRLKPTTVTAVGGAGVVDANVLSIAKAQGYKTSRLGGDDRIETAIKISQHVYRGKANAVYVVGKLGPQGNGSPDAVAGANVKNGPILLNVENGKVDPRVRKEINRLGGKTYELGGGSLGTGGTKLAGRDRYETAAKIAKHAYGDKPSTVYLVRGDDPIDAVAAGILTEGPRLLVHPNRTSTVPCDYLRTAKPSKIIVVGGSGAVSDGVYDQAVACSR